MDPMTAASLAMAVGGAAGSFLNKKKDPGAAMRQAAMDEIARVQTPDLESMRIQLDQLVQQGLISPEEAQAALVDKNAYEDISVDPTMRGAQMEALQGLQDVYHEGGLTSIDRARLQQIQDEQASVEKGQREAIMDNARRRGVSGSGMEIASQLMAQQGAADRSGRAGLETAAMAQQRALEAMMESGRMGGQIEDRDYQQKAAKAQAANAIAQFNASNTQQVNMANTAAKNAAQAANLGERQRIADTNTSQTNLNRARNADLIQTKFQNDMEKAKAVAGAATNSAQAADNRQAQNMSFYGGLTSLGGNMFSANEDRKLKEKAMQREYGYAKGGKVPGTPNVEGDHSSNDTVPALLSPGELVVPRTQADEVEELMGSLPRSEKKPSVEAVKTMLQALSEMGC